MAYTRRPMHAGRIHDNNNLIGYNTHLVSMFLGQYEKLLQPARPEAQPAIPEGWDLAGWLAGPQAWLAGPQAWLAGPQARLDGPEGGTDGRMNVRMNGRKSPHSTGLHPLSGPLPKNDKKSIKMSKNLKISKRTHRCTPRGTCSLNLRLRVCLAMCLIFQQSEPSVLINRVLIKKRMCNKQKINSIKGKLLW